MNSFPTSKQDNESYTLYMYIVNFVYTEFKLQLCYIRTKKCASLKDYAERHPIVGEFYRSTALGMSLYKVVCMSIIM